MLYEVSWSKSEKGFRWIDPEGEVFLSKTEEGEMDMVGTKNEIGRLMVECTLEKQGTHAQVTPSEGSVAVLPPADAVLKDWNGYCRMCYRRAQQDWRIRDEKFDGKGTGIIEFVQTYVGRVKVYHYDGIGHLFHGHPERRDGLVSIKDRIAYLH